MNTLNNEKTDGEKIVKSMTDPQLACLIDILLKMIDEKNIKSLFEYPDSNFSEILFTILNKNNRIHISIDKNSKYRKEWEKLWAKWFDIISELGNESGDYIYQDHHWETPYFSEYTFTEDLEKIAKELFLIIDVIEKLEDKDRDFFVDMLRDIESGINEYPEWLGANYSCFTLGPFTTKCVLKWEWLAASSKEDIAQAFIERMDKIDCVLKLLELDLDTFISFFTSFEENIQRHIYEIIKSYNDNVAWQERLGNICSKWHILYHFFSSLFDFEEYLKNCLKHLSNNWSYGIPLIEDLIKRQNYKKAEKIIKRTFNSLLNLSNKTWLPERTSITEYSYFFNSEPDTRVIKLLKEWIVISEETNSIERKLMLSVQLEIYKNPYQFENITKIFKKIIYSKYSDSATTLFIQWQNFIVKTSLGSNIFNYQKIYDSWINWLIETGIDDSKDKSWFINKVRDWICSITDDPAQFQKFYKYIILITGDLFYISQVCKKYPTLFSIIKYDWNEKSDFSIARCKWHKKLNTVEILPDIINAWKNNIISLIPDPARAQKSEYSNHAKWLLATSEINSEAYVKIINKWKIDHRNRKNLWKSIKEFGLTV